jgi:hypothetical protein
MSLPTADNWDKHRHGSRTIICLRMKCDGMIVLEEDLNYLPTVLYNPVISTIMS